MSDSRVTRPESRCTYRKHVIENGARFCDCEQLMVGKTAAKNAQVVTLLVANDVERGLRRDA